MEDLIYHVFELEEAARSADFAAIRCLSSDALIARATTLPIDKQSQALITVLAERELSEVQITTIEERMRSISNHGERASSRDKPRIDSVIKRLVELLPVEASSKFALEQLGHARKARRDIAVRVLRRQGVAPDAALGLWGLFEKTRDEGLLELIARVPEVVPDSRPADLLKYLSEPYWKGRVFEALIRHAPELVERFASSHPAEFLHGAGRASSAAFAPLATMILQQNTSDPVTLRMAVWYFGKIRQAEQVSALQAKIDHELAKSRAAANLSKT